ncbi:glucokinase [Neisseria flavescens]|nr:glucokinase [Neisseria flavescens]
MSTMHTEAYPRLVADIGGTNARFALETAPQVIEKAEVLPCKDYDTVVDAAKTYLERAGSPKVLHAAFAIANPILGDWVQMTNHHWAFSIETTRQALGLETLILLNDFTAQALAVTKTERMTWYKSAGKSPSNLRLKPSSARVQVWVSAVWCTAPQAGWLCQARAAIPAFRRLTIWKC